MTEVQNDKNFHIPFHLTTKPSSLHLWRMSLMIVISVLISACSDNFKEKIAQQTPITEQRIEQLAIALENAEVRNANLIKQYAVKVTELKGELKPIIDELAKDATPQGPMYKSLVTRLETVKTQPTMFENNEAIYEELMNLYQAADPLLFSDLLSDPLNVLADMSEGQLPRVNALSKEQSLLANNAQDFGTGEQLIGNPNYGSWQRDSSGMSFWAWYGMYSMMGDLFGRRTYYNDWGRSRNYSYYNDYGRTRYSSPSQLNKQSTLDASTRKSFEQQGKPYTSAYSKNRTGSSSLSSQSKNAQTSANRFQSKSTSKSSYSKNSSFRNSSSKTSRSSRRGK